MHQTDADLKPAGRPLSPRPRRLLLLAWAPRVIAAAAAALLLSPAAAGARRKPASVGLPNFVDLAREVVPSVVHVSTQSKGGFGGGRRSDRGVGSGFVYDREGHVVTNHHVVEGAKEIYVSFPSSAKRYEAKLVGSDPLSDLALLRIEAPPKDVRPLRLATEDALEVGEWVLAVGSPFDLPATVTAGIVSAKGRHIDALRYENFIQTDASINPGNSGGPLVNLDGQVVGVNTLILSRSGGNIGIGFAIPIELAAEVITQLRDRGEVVRGWLGVSFVEGEGKLPSEEALRAEVEAGAAVISRVVPGGPAEKAGVQAGDVIVGWAGREVDDVGRLPFWVAAVAPGSEVEVAVRRAGEVVKLKVTLGQLGEELAKAEGEDPAEGEERGTGAGRNAAPEGSPPFELGAELTELDKEAAEALGVDGGLKVSALAAKSPAQAAGVRAGDVIIRVGDTEIHSLKALDEALSKLAGKSKAVVIHAIRDGRRRLFVVKRPARESE